MADVIYRLEIRGRVQGVYYRQSMVEYARNTGVRGWVRNRLDGSVEAVVAGDTDAVDKTIAWCRQGPPQAAVSAVELFPIELFPETAEISLEYFQQRETL